MISSRQHPQIKLARALHSSKGRRENGLFLVEGPNSVAAALEANWPIQSLLAREENELTEAARRQNIAVFLVEAEILVYASDAQSSPGVLAFAALPKTQKDWDLDGLLLVGDEISDPGNVGTLLRAADAVRAAKAVFSAGSADIFAPKAVRSAAGSLFSLPPLNLENRAPFELVAALKEKTIPIFTAEAHGGQNPFDFAWPHRCALILGHETRGISPEFRRAATQKLTIPIAGNAESLNVAMAGTLLLFAWRNAQS